MEPGDHNGLSGCAFWVKVLGEAKISATMMLQAFAALFGKEEIPLPHKCVLEGEMPLRPPPPTGGLLYSGAQEARTSWMRYCLKNSPLQVTTHVSIITTNLVSPPLAPEFVALSKVKCQRNVLRQLQKLTNMAIDITTVLQFFQFLSCKDRDLSSAETVSDTATPLLPCIVHWD